jgi:hypothetical protein
MENKQRSFSDESYRVRDVSDQHFSQLKHSFVDSWLSILTPAEFMVFVVMLRYSQFRTNETEGRFRVSRCSKTTGLNRKTVLKAMSTLRQWGVITLAPRNGQSALISINQDVTAPLGVGRIDKKQHKFTREPVPPTGTGPVPPTGTGPVPPTGTGPVPPTGTGPVPPTGTTPVPPSGTASERLQRLRDSEKAKDGDDEREKEASLLIEGFLSLNQTLDQAMAINIISDMRKVRPDVAIGEMILIARDRLPVVLRSKRVEFPMPYLRVAMVGCLKDPTFIQFRKRFQILEEERLRSEREYQELQDWCSRHPLQT